MQTEQQNRQHADQESVTRQDTVNDQRLKTRKHDKLRRLSRKEFVSSKLQRDYQQHVRLAQDFFLKGQNQKAEKEAILALRIRPTAHICALFAAIAQSQGQYNRASDFRLLQAFLARDVQLWEELLHQFLSQNLFYKSIICLQRLSALQNNNAQRYRMLQLQLADLFIGLGQIQRATNVLVPLWNSSKCRDFQVFALLAGLYFQLGKWNSLQRLVQSSLRYAFRLSFNALDADNNNKITDKHYEKNGSYTKQENNIDQVSNNHQINVNKTMSLDANSDNSNNIIINTVCSKDDGDKCFVGNKSVKSSGHSSQQICQVYTQCSSQQKNVNAQNKTQTKDNSINVMPNQQKQKSIVKSKRTTKRVRFFGLDDDEGDQYLRPQKYKHADQQTRLQMYGNTLETTQMKQQLQKQQYDHYTKLQENEQINRNGNKNCNNVWHIEHDIDDWPNNKEIAIKKHVDNHVNSNVFDWDHNTQLGQNQFTFDGLVDIENNHNISTASGNGYQSQKYNNNDKINNINNNKIWNESEKYNASSRSIFTDTNFTSWTHKDLLTSNDMQERQTRDQQNNKVMQTLTSVNNQAESLFNTGNSYSATLAAQAVRNMYGQVIVFKNNTTRRNFLTLVNVHTQLLNQRGKYWETISLLQHTSACLQVKILELPPDLLVRLATAYAFIGNHDTQCKQVMQYVLKTCPIDQYGDVLLDAAVNLQKVGMYQGAIDIYINIAHFFQQQLSCKMNELKCYQHTSCNRKTPNQTIEIVATRDDINNIKTILSSAYSGHAHCLYALCNIDESYLLACRAKQLDKQNLQVRLLLAKILFYHRHNLENAVTVLTPNLHEPALHRIQLGIFLVRLFKQANKYVESVALGVSIFDLILNSYDDGDNQSVAPGSSKRSAPLLQLPSMSRASSAIVAANTLTGAARSNSLYAMSSYVNNSQSGTTLLSTSMAASIRASSSVFQQQHNRRGQGALTTTIYGSSAAAASRAGSIVDKDDKSELSQSQVHQDASFIFRFHRKRRAQKQHLSNVMKLQQKAKEMLIRSEKREKKEKKNYTEDDDREEEKGSELSNELKLTSYDNDSLNSEIVNTPTLQSDQRNQHDNRTLLQIKGNEDAQNYQDTRHTRAEKSTIENTRNEYSNNFNIISSEGEGDDEYKKVGSQKNCQDNNKQNKLKQNKIYQLQQQRLDESNKQDVLTYQEQSWSQQQIPSLEQVSKTFDDPVMAALFLNISTQNPITSNNLAHNSYDARLIQNNDKFISSVKHQCRQQEQQQYTQTFTGKSEKDQSSAIDKSINASNFQNNNINAIKTYDNDIYRVTTRQVIAAIGQRSLLQLAVNIVQCYSLLDKFTQAKQFASVAVSRFAKRKLFRQMGNTLERPLRLAILRAALTAEQSEDAYRIGLRLLQEDSTANERNQVFLLLHSVLNKCEDRSSILYRLFMQGACDVPLIVLLANRYYQTRSFSRVLNLYLIALKERPNDVLLNFLVGLTYLLCSHQKPSRQREGCVSAGMYYLNQYQSLLIASNVQRTGEAMYNCARALQYLRVFYLCIPLYKEIAFNLPTPSHCTLEIKHAAQFNLYWIYYHNSGNRELALASLPRLL